MNQIEDPEMIFLSINLDRDMYFNILQACIDRRMTIDEFFIEACQKYIAEEDKQLPLELKYD